MRRLWLAILALLMAQPVASDPADPGRAVFEGLSGAPGYVAIGRDKVSATRFPCRSCHRRDGRGGGEGDAPPIVWEALARPTKIRPAYDARAFARLLATGEAPSGELISRLMPRYDLDSEVMAELITHLSGLTAEQKTGIHAEKIVLGVPFQKDIASSGLLVVESLEVALREKMPPNGLFGRKIELRPLVGTTDEILARAREEVAALLSPLPPDESGLLRFTSAGIPVLFPIGAVTGRSDNDLLRTLYPSRERIADLLFQKASADGCQDISVAGGSPRVSANILATEPIELTESAPDRLRDCLVIADGHITPEALGRPEAIYILKNDISELKRALEGYRGSVIVGLHDTAATNLAKTKTIDPLGAHSVLVAEVLHDVLLDIGRDLTRTNLLMSIDTVARPDLGLDFPRNSPSGSTLVTFQSFTVVED